MSDDPELESFLRQFKPVAPPPLVRRRRRTRTVWLAVAVAASVAIALVLPRTGREPARAPEGMSDRGPASLTMGALQAAVRAGTYDSALDRLDAHALPDPARRGGALQTLGDVRRDF